MLTVPCWLRRFWETDNLFSCEERIKRKKNAERALLSIHLFISLSSLSLDLSLHIPHVLPYSFWPFIIFLCPTAFWSLPCSLVFPSFLLSSFLHHLPVFLSYLTGLWASLSTSRILHSYYSQSFIPPSLSPAIPTWFLSLSFKLAGLDGVQQRGMPWLHPMTSVWFRYGDSSCLCGSDPVTRVMDFPGVPEKGSQSWTSTCQCGQKVKTVASP